MPNGSGSKLCSIDGCGRPLAATAISAFCARCRSGLYYWRRKTPKQRVARKQTLHMLACRLEELP
jgi:hypothetical protein